MSTLRGFAFAFAFGALAFGGLALQRKAPAPHTATTAAVPTYDHAVAELTAKKKLAETLADAEPGSWSRRAGAASLEMAYAQLTGDYDGYVAADASMAEAFRIARSSIDDDAVGPLLLKAQLSYELHRLRPALAALDAPEKQATYFHDDALLSEIASLRGAITFQLGEYDAGIALLRKAVALGPTPAHKQRLAIALANVGGEEEASRIFDETARATDAPRSLAWIELQRAKMSLAHGRRAEGRRHLENAKELFPGWWQAEEHLAELDAEEGHVDRAIASYRTLVARTGDPEFMDALAALVDERDPAEAKSLRARSNALYEDRLVKLPEASYGHALEHFLKFTADPSRAVEIAERNVALRPNGEARTRLAQAYVRVGRLDDARAEIARVLATSWMSAETFATAAVVLRLADDPEAEAFERKATALDPHAIEEITWLRPAQGA